MATKKTAEPEIDATERVVDVTVPSGQGGIAANDIYKAALSAVRNEIPNRSDLAYEIVDSEKKDDQRVYHIKISWGAHEAGPSPTDPADGNFVAQHIASLEVPTALPAEKPDA